MMATVCNSVYYDCLQEFQKDITNGITQTDINVDRLTEKAKKKGLLSSGYSVRPDSGRLVASREKKAATLVSRCIESVKRNGDLFQSFVALLEAEAGLQHLARRIRRKLEQGGDLKFKRGKAPPPSEDSGFSASVSSTGQFLPPLSEIPTTSQLPSHRSFTHNEETPRQSEQRMSRSRRQRSKSLPNYGDESELSLQPLTSPIHSSRRPMWPVEETQEEDNSEDLVVPDIQPRPLSSEDLMNAVFEERQAQTERAELQKETKALSQDKQTLEKELEKKQTKINELQTRHQRIEKEKDEYIKSLEEQVGKSKKELERLRKKTAELERELQQKDIENQELKKSFSEEKRKIQNQHEQDIEKLKTELQKEKAKAEKKEINIRELEYELLQKELEKEKIVNQYRERERQLERERDDLKVLLAEQKREEEERKRKAAEQKAERERRKSQAIIEELEKKLNRS